MPEFNPTLVTSRWKAYDPDGNFKEIVKLTSKAKARYERMGWTFTRPPRMAVWNAEREN